MVDRVGSVEFLTADVLLGADAKPHHEVAGTWSLEIIQTQSRFEADGLLAVIPSASQ